MSLKSLLLSLPKRHICVGGRVIRHILDVPNYPTPNTPNTSCAPGIHLDLCISEKREFARQKTSNKVQLSVSFPVDNGSMGCITHKSRVE